MLIRTTMSIIRAVNRIHMTNHIAPSFSDDVLLISIIGVLLILISGGGGTNSGIGSALLEQQNLFNNSSLDEMIVIES